MHASSALAQRPSSNRKARRKAAKSRSRADGNGRGAAAATRQAGDDINIRFDDENSVRDGLARFTRAVQEEPGNAQAHLVLGLLYSHQRNYDAAYPVLKRAATLAPGNWRAWSGLGGCLYNLNHFEAAAIAYREAAARAPQEPNVLLLLGRTLSASGRSDEALKILDRALDVAPDYAHAHYFSGQEYRVRGDFEKAREAYEKALTLDPELAGVYHDLSRIDNTPEQARELLERIDKLKSGRKLNHEKRVVLWFAMANFRNKLKEYDAAFEAFRQGNAEAGAATPAHWIEYLGQVADTIQGYRPEAFEALKEAGGNDATPIFIVGMPRSGTTLVEQIVSSHPDVYAAGELPRLQKIVSVFLGSKNGKISYPRDVAQMQPEVFRELARDYLSHLRRTAPEDCLKITDKLPFNYLNLGLIAVMFPKATVIHCRRDPVDTCLSCFFQNFNKLGNVWFANDLADLGRYYRNYERVMAHWREVLPLPIMDVQYEELVADQEAVSRKLIAHAGLEWDDACLEFHKNERAVATASVWQVRQPVYSSSIARWKRYEKHLGPLLEALENREQN